MSCIFCEIAAGQAPAHIVWESESHLAFLSIFPNTPGFTVVIPKLHASSYAFAQTDQALTDLTLAAKSVALLLDRALPNVARTGMMLEGYGVDHLHAKLFPMHGTGTDSEFKKISSSIDKYFTQYEGYISSHDWKRADDEALAELAKSIREYSAQKTL
ncbi:HIT family protein [Pseudomonas sp. 10S4]|uniref:HIT family protein n=1 Tax=Pseudomonas sp. 10S4 TaxID=3048583 RepID=UPI002AC8ECF9|nr:MULTISPECIES: HIT family protein [unclassified Pseudomonas]MEB0225435.1 HIT family protein [Pseudomonas sp. 5S1]MEB0297207.1 HIT family protein [Pseudomonas sp. 10S4]WPX19459.1 HIT family protein [Pseudomonas sp. 10S4]